jgi:hypothetical protein
MRSSFHRFGRAAALVAGASSLGLPAIVHAQMDGKAPEWSANDDDALLFDVRMGKYRLGDGVRGYQTPTGVCVDTADMILALDVPVRLDKKLRRATGWALNEGQTLTIDREQNIEHIANKKNALPKNTIYDTPEGWCTDVKALSRWFGITMKVDLSNAVLLLDSEAKLPVLMSLERREKANKIRPMASFDLKTLPKSTIPYRGITPPAIDAVIDFGFAAGRGKDSANARYAVYASGEVGPVAYDARVASNNKFQPESLRLRAYRNDPDGQMLGPLKATQIAVGDVTGQTSQLVAESTIGRGAFVSNRPLERQATFDRTDFRGELPNGWDAELYRNDQLIGFASTRADGRYEFLNIPLLYGQNRFEVVLYGPQGQVRRDSRMVNVGPESIPPKHIWYSWNMVQDGRDLVGISDKTPLFGGGRYGTGRWRGNFQMEAGLNRMTSVSVGYHSLFLPEVGRRNYLETGLRLAVGPALFEYNAASDLIGGSALSGRMLAQFGKSYVSVESFKAFGGYQSDFFRRGVVGQDRVSFDRVIQLGRSAIPLHVDAAHVTYKDGRSQLTLDTRASARMGRYYVTGFYEIEKDRAPRGPDPPATMTAGALVNGRFGKVMLRGEARYRVSNNPGFERATAVAEWSGKGSDKYQADWRTQFDYDARSDIARASLGYIRRFEKLALTAQAGVASNKSVSAGLNLSFSLGPDPRRQGGWRMTSSRLASQGQILARVYRDKNADGIRQADEPFEKDVQLAAGRVPVDRLTDANGEVIIEDLMPFRAALIGIDAASLSDPLIQPGGPGIVVTPRPGKTGVVELALTSAGEIDGSIVKSGGGGLEGVDLELVDTRGNVVATTRSDFDGFFLFEKVPYGRFTVRIARLSAEAIRVQTALEANAHVSDTSPSVHLGTVVAEPDAIRNAANPSPNAQ